MVSNISKAAGAAQSAKTVVHREDPVARLERLLAEAKAKSTAAARAQLSGARDALKRADAQLERWTRIRHEAATKVAKLEVDAAAGASEAPANEGSPE
jgi:hypothetical protein